MCTQAEYMASDARYWRHSGKLSPSIQRLGKLCMDYSSNIYPGQAFPDDY